MPSPVKDALPLIKCSVCEHAMYQAVRNTLDYIAERSVQHKLREERLIDHVLEPLCRPFTEGGAWLRASDWDVVNGSAVMQKLKKKQTAQQDEDAEAKESENENDTNILSTLKQTATIKFKLLPGRNYKCGERCSTAAAACDELMTKNDAGDHMAHLLIHSFGRLREDAETEQLDDDSAPVKVARRIVMHVCRDRYMQCTDGKQLQRLLALRMAASYADDEFQAEMDRGDENDRAILKKFLRRGSKENAQKKKKKPAPGSPTSFLTSKILRAPAVVAIESKEVEVEEMMYRMKYGLKKPKQGAVESDRGYDDDDDRSGGGGVHGGAGGNPGVDVYSRDEMMTMREALQTGNRERLRDIDPSSDDLSDEEFQLLTKMHKNEFGAGAGGADRDL